MLIASLISYFSDIFNLFMDFVSNCAPTIAIAFFLLGVSSELHLIKHVPYSFVCSEHSYVFVWLLQILKDYCFQFIKPMKDLALVKV